MAQIRYNNALGIIESIDDSSTTIAFGAAPSFATLADGDYIALTLDPPSGPAPNTSFERVYLTAYTEGATTGTVSRAQEGTTAVTHLSGTVWMNAPTVLDIGSGSGAPSIILNFTQSTDIAGISVPNTTWTAVPATQNFTIADGSDIIQICLSGCVQMYLGDNNGSRVNIDGGEGSRVNIDGGEYTFLIGGSPDANSNILSGAGTIFIPGGTLSAGEHTLDLEVYVRGSSSGSVYCRAASFPEIEGLTIQVVEF